MKANQKTFVGMAPRAARDARIFFFCGPDEAGAHAAAVRIVSSLADAGERVEIPGAELKRDPVRLADETRSSSLFGDRRHIFVRAAGDEAHDAVQLLCEGDAADIEQGWPVLIVASGATDKSRTAKLLDKRGDALVAMFYPPDLNSVANEIRAMADAAGLRMGAEFAERIARAVRLDTRLAQAEVDKLALYLDAAPQAPRTVEVEALDAVIAACEDDSMMPLVNAVLSGDTARLPAELMRFRQSGLNPVATVLAMERRAAQLSQLAARLGAAGDVSGFIKQEERARRVFFRDAPHLVEQLRRWRGPRLARLVDRLIALHRALLADSRAAELLFAAGCAEIARAGRSTRTNGGPRRTSANGSGHGMSR